MKRSRRIQSLTSFAWLMACSAYVWASLRYDLDDSRTLYAAAIAGVWALAAFVYSVVRPKFHERVTKSLIGGGAVVATACAVLFLQYGWAEREMLADLSVLPLFTLFTLMALAAAVFAWISFWSFVLPRRPNPKP